MAAPLPIDDIAKLVQSITPAAAVKLAHAAAVQIALDVNLVDGRLGDVVHG